MNYFLGEAGALADARFQKNIRGKKFSYIGKENEGYFLEDIINEVIKKSGFTKSDGLYEIAVSDKSKTIIIIFGDNLAGPGESSAEYSLDDFSEEIIVDLVDQVITDQNELLTFTIEDNTIFFEHEASDFSFSCSFDEINPELMVSGTKKVVIWLQRNKWNVIAGIFMLALPFSENLIYQKTIYKKHLATMEELKSDEISYRRKKESAKKKWLILSKEYNLIQKENDFFDDFFDGLEKIESFENELENYNQKENSKGKRKIKKRVPIRKR